MRQMIFKPFNDFPRGTILSLLRQSYGADIMIDPECFRKWLDTWEKYDDEVYSCPNTTGSCGFISCLGDIMAGFGSWDPRQYPEKGIIGHNCTVPAFRKNGYGRLQIEKILDWFRQRGFKRAVVSTGDTDFFVPAQLMYKSCGFKETSRAFKTTDSSFRTIEYELIL